MKRAVTSALACIFSVASLAACASDPADEPPVEPEKTGQTSSAMVEDFAVESSSTPKCYFIPYTCTWRLWYGCVEYGSCWGTYTPYGVPECTTGCN